MPRYSYQCSICKGITEISHSIRETMTDCTECKEKNTLNKFLGHPINYRGGRPFTQRPQVGKVVRDAIEESKKELMSQKDKLSKKHD